MKQYAVIVAGGRGVRMQSDLPKQFISIGGNPVLMHTLRAFNSYQESLPLIVVLPEHEHDRWHFLCQEFSFKIPHTLIAGGSCRPHSVRNGLREINEPDSLVAIHDGVRPLVSIDLIARSFQTAQKHGAAIASVPLKDSIREVTDNGSVSRDRARYRLMQTPQTFRTSLLRKAYDKVSPLENYTDEASIVEAYGEEITLIDGEYRNLKITTPEDLRVAEAFLSQKASQ
uniref:2-C-methyl-D-erythritol 4-phosphate cytidylyltransferase n=1 Tax=Roseihalotalea indica TaxID=2867963 RepID=A0AA49GN14_9BACT|nr:2-C-methyl-D-erythritol 4-phosphate cytidylyltransferase [Tunicatimonas sp. TK19036]